MSSPDDSQLRASFANLREEDRIAAPPFARTAASAGDVSRRRASFWRIALAALPVLAILLVFALRTHRSTGAGPRELAAWYSPTAFLLETPGRQLLNQTPRLGVPLFHSQPAAQDRPK